MNAAEKKTEQKKTCSRKKDGAEKNMQQKKTCSRKKNMQQKKTCSRKKHAAEKNDRAEKNHQAEKYIVRRKLPVAFSSKRRSTFCPSLDMFCLLNGNVSLLYLSVDLRCNQTVI